MKKVEKLFSNILTLTGIAALSRNTLGVRGSFVIEFHGIAKQRYPNIPLKLQPSLIRSELKSILLWISRRFRFLSPDQFFSNRHKGVLLTFDDGMANNYRNVIPLLNEYKAPAIFFISTQHITNPKKWLPAIKKMQKIFSDEFKSIPEEVLSEFYDGMSEQQVVEASKNPLITIGSHTISHPFLTECKKADIIEELKISKQYIEKLIDQSVNYFCYPTGDYNIETIKIAKATGYNAAFTEESLNLCAPLFEIPRIGIYSADPKYLALKLSGLFRKPIQIN